jgi:ankyrin repeat protein
LCLAFNAENQSHLACFASSRSTAAARLARLAVRMADVRAAIIAARSLYVCLCVRGRCPDMSANEAPRAQSQKMDARQERLVEAVRDARYEDARAALGDGATPCMRFVGRRSLLHMAPNARIAALLIGHGANPMDRDEMGLTPAHCAASADRADVLSTLMAAASTPAEVARAVSTAGVTPLHCACASGSVACAWLLLEVDKSLLEQRASAAAPWSVVAAHVRAPSQLRLFDAAVERAIRDTGCVRMTEEKTTPLHCICWGPSAARVFPLCRSWLRRNPSELMRATEHGWTALHIAVARRNRDAALWLLREGSSPHTRETGSGMTPLTTAASTGDATIVRALLAAGADALERTDHGATSMHLAAGKGNKDALLALLQRGVDVDVPDTLHGLTPLHSACMTGHTECAELLLAFGARVSHRNAHGLTALHCAAAAGFAETVRAICTLPGVDVNVLDSHGYNAADSARAVGQLAAVRELSRFGVTPSGPRK